MKGLDTDAIPMLRPLSDTRVQIYDQNKILLVVTKNTKTLQIFIPESHMQTTKINNTSISVLICG